MCDKKLFTAFMLLHFGKKSSKRANFDSTIQEINKLWKKKKRATSSIKYKVDTKVLKSIVIPTLQIDEEVWDNNPNSVKEALNLEELKSYIPGLD